MTHAAMIGVVLLGAAAADGAEVVITFDKVETGKPVPSYTDKDQGVEFALSRPPARSKAAGRVMFFPHLKTDRKGILNAMADESIPVEVRFPKPVSSVTLELWGSIGSAAVVEAYDKDGKVVDTAKRDKVPERTGPEKPIPSFELTVKAPAIAYVRFSAPRRAATWCATRCGSPRPEPKEPEKPTPTTYCNPISLPNYPLGRRARDVTVGAPVPKDDWLWLVDKQQQFRELADVSVLWHEGAWYLYPSVDMAWVSKDGGATWQHHPLNVRDLGYAADGRQAQGEVPADGVGVVGVHGGLAAGAVQGDRPDQAAGGGAGADRPDAVLGRRRPAVLLLGLHADGGDLRRGTGRGRPDAGDRQAGEGDRVRAGQAALAAAGRLERAAGAGVGRRAPGCSSGTGSTT